MKRVLRQSLRMAISASMILALAAPLTAHAAEEIYYYDSYINKTSGIQLYSVGQVDGNQFVDAVVARQQDGSYAKWQEPFQYFRKNDSGSLQLTGNDDPEQSYVYDPQSQSILRKTIYALSPDGKWGYLERSRYLLMPTSPLGSGYIGKFNDHYLKNMKTGAVSVYYSSQRYYRALWLNQHTLLESGYNETARQNVISTYNPSTGERQELLKGTMYNWNFNKGIIYYVKNEPQRLPWVYDLKSGTSRLITDYSELETLFPASPSSRPEAVLPQDTVLKDLPVVEIPVALTYEYSVNLDGQSVDVSTVFSNMGQDWIPVKPLAAALGWSIEVPERSSAVDRSAGYSYEISSGSKSVNLTPANSFNSGSRLYISQAQLKQLGYSSIAFTPYLQK
ncbi:hypothetical protein [Paenibacillus borealis]|uniref:Copper amine oxidase-like N-terminal domain-containing protein n=1 Tax=Paenibacillus borealis TaxID=160799 RepID=A0A089MT20_PAEBO|nr:hypothetical protein [Paenibacillus borealis]AIQ59609.1 hypothetical protein PBOR_23640 [Paenibacillus borealis]